MVAPNPAHDRHREDRPEDHEPGWQEDLVGPMTRVHAVFMGGGSEIRVDVVKSKGTDSCKAKVFSYQTKAVQDIIRDDDGSLHVVPAKGARLRVRNVAERVEVRLLAPAATP